MTAAEHTRARFRRGWLILASTVIAIVLVAVVDAYLKRAPHTGFVLANADFSATAPNLPVAWAQMERSAAFRRIREEVPQIRQRLELVSRHRTGIRWTPLRWYVWCGRPIAISESDGEWVMSCRPGLLLGAARALDLLGHARVRDGFLILGTSQDIVDTLVRHGTAVDFERPSDSVSISWRAHSQGEATLRFARECEVSGSILVEPAGDQPTVRNRNIAPWPGSPALSLYVSRRADLDELIPDVWPDFPFSSELQHAADDFRARLPSDWNASADSYNYVLVSVDTRGVVPIPEFGVILRSAGPFPPLPAPQGSIPYIWGATPGWMQPWRGEPLSLYAASDRRTRVFANQERAIDSVLSVRITERISASDARLDADFTQIASIARALVRTAAKEQLLPAYSPQDAEREILPWIDAVGEMGQLTLDGRVVGDRLEFSGAFSTPAETDGGGGP
jgi:hypothetical protein